MGAETQYPSRRARGLRLDAAAAFCPFGAARATAALPRVTARCRGPAVRCSPLTTTPLSPLHPSHHCIPLTSAPSHHRIPLTSTPLTTAPLSPLQQTRHAAHRATRMPRTLSCAKHRKRRAPTARRAQDTYMPIAMSAVLELRLAGGQEHESGAFDSPISLCRPRRASDLPDTPTPSSFEDKRLVAEPTWDNAKSEATAHPASAGASASKEAAIAASNAATSPGASASLEPKGRENDQLPLTAIALPFAAPMAEDAVVNQAPVPGAAIALSNAGAVLPMLKSAAACGPSTKLSRQQRKMLTAPPPFVPEVRAIRQHYRLS